MSDPGVWVCVYRGGNVADAWLMGDWLERNGVEVWVRDQLSMALGQLPADESAPSVWVRGRDRVAAVGWVERWSGPALVHPRWRCACGEENDPNFGSCWSCGADAP